MFTIAMRASEALEEFGLSVEEALLHVLMTSPHGRGRLFDPHE